MPVKSPDIIENIFNRLMPVANKNHSYGKYIEDAEPAGVKKRGITVLIIPRRFQQRLLYNFNRRIMPPRLTFCLFLNILPLIRPAFFSFLNV